ncbi:MAG: sensor histidine kinase [Crocinitomicaceae bacterium]
MLKEIHHRVKNNLQVIRSLLRLQSREIENQSSHSHFKEAIDRVSAMALIHNQMYQSKDLDRINLEPYLQSLSKNILHSYALEIPVDIQFDISLAHASSNNIVPMALIFNELMSNSLKHAFNEQTRGLITVEAYQSSDKRIEFIYADNGQWKPPEREDSFGMELIETLAEQLGGNVERNTEKGTKFTFIFESEYL